MCVPHTDSQASLVLVGDVGGTNARLSLWETQGKKDASELRAKVGRSCA